MRKMPYHGPRPHVFFIFMPSGFGLLTLPYIYRKYVGASRLREKIAKVPKFCLVSNWNNNLGIWMCSEARTVRLQIKLRTGTVDRIGRTE